MTACSKVFPPSPYNCENLPRKYQALPESPRYMFILWRAADISPEQFRTLLFGEFSSYLLAQESEEIRYWLTDNNIDSITLREHPLADGSEVAAVISMDLVNKQVALDIVKKLQPQLSFMAAYKVSNSLPLAYNKNWPDSEVSPGVVSMSFFRRAEGMEYQAFKDYWFCAHTPYALDIHPLWRYERNPVLEALTKDAPDYDAIVPLHMQEDEQFTDIFQFLGADKNWPLSNALSLQNDVSNFIDLEKIEATAMREYVMRSQRSVDLKEGE